MRRRERGQASIELLLAVLVLSALFFGGVELAKGVAVKHALDVGVSEAARGLALDPTQYTWADALVRAEVTDNVMGGDLGSSITLRLLDAGGAEITPAMLVGYAFGTTFRVRAEVPFQAVVPFVPGLSARAIAAEHWAVVERYP